MAWTISRSLSQAYMYAWKRVQWDHTQTAAAAVAYQLSQPL